MESSTVKSPCAHKERKPHTLCFVCSGNTCRSPMAAAVYNHLHKGQETHAISRGIAVCPNTPIHPYAVIALQKAGIPSTGDNPYESHTALPLTESVVAQCDEIICLTSRHLMAVLMAFPHAVDKIHGMGEIDDPFGGDEQDYENTLARIREALCRE